MNTQSEERGGKVGKSMYDSGEREKERERCKEGGMERENYSCSFESSSSGSSSNGNVAVDTSNNKGKGRHMNCHACNTPSIHPLRARGGAHIDTVGEIKKEKVKDGRH